jgi:exonuclease VII large subunit
LREIIAADKKQDSSKNQEELAITWLRERFINLKKENKVLRESKVSIAKEMEEVREEEKRQIEQMTQRMYTKSKEMQKIQTEIEKIQEINTKLDNEFEHQVTQRNKSKQEAHQIVYSINNIYRVAEMLYQHRDIEHKFKKLEQEADPDKAILKIEQGDPQALERHVRNIII